MKKLLLVALLFCGLQSCSKKEETTTTPQTSTASLKFTANGTQYTFTGTPVSKYETGTEIINDFGTPKYATLQALEVQVSGQNRNSILIPFLLNSSGGNTLTTGTYTVNNIISDSRIAGVRYAETTTCTVTITSVANNKYSGTFSATLKSTLPVGTINITNGSFTNLTYRP